MNNSDPHNRPRRSMRKRVVKVLASIGGLLVVCYLALGVMTLEAYPAKLGGWYGSAMVSKYVREHGKWPRSSLELVRVSYEGEVPHMIRSGEVRVSFDESPDGQTLDVTVYIDRTLDWVYVFRHGKDGSVRPVRP